MYEYWTDQLNGLKVIETHDAGDGTLAILFEDGIILFVGSENGVVFAGGTGWEECWNTLTK